MRSILLYFAFVGIPALGVLGILELGQGLTAPAALGGNWNVKVRAQPTSAPLCGTSLIGADKLALTISQSGPNLQIIFNDRERTTLTGAIQEATVIAATATTANQQTPSTNLNLRAKLDRQNDQAQLHGVLTFIGCPSQATTPFTATRQLGSNRLSGRT